MSDAPTSLRHADSSKDDAALAEESRLHVANSPALQLIAELVTKLRTSRFPWWTPEIIRSTWDAKTRMTWFAERPDIRQRITCSLTGLAPKASRNKAPDFQAALIDSVVDDGDVTADQLENAFDPVEIAAYAPVNDLWHKFKERMPWDQDTAAHQELVGWLLDQFLASSSTIEGMTRKPILTSHAVRTTIPGKIWHSKIPLEVRVAIDDLRFQRERAKPGEPFHAIHDLSVATPTIIATNIPLRELLRVIDVAEKAMGLESRSSHASPPPKPEETKAAEPPKEVAKPAENKAQPAVPPAAAAPEKSQDKALADKVAPEKAAPEKATADKAAPAEKAPKSAIERMADKVLEKVVAKDAASPKAESPKAETPKAPPASTALPGTPIGKPGQAAPQAGPAAAVPPPPAPGAALPAPPGGEPITARGPKSETDIAPQSENGEDIVVDTDDSFKFDDEDEGTGVGTKEDPRVLSKKQEVPPPPAPPIPVPKR
jgi:hypothetical protein